jgi:hypothetical protein
VLRGEAIPPATTYRQPHCALAGARVNLGRTEDVDPYLPGHGSLAWSVTHYDLELEYKVTATGSPPVPCRAGRLRRAR